MRNLLAQIARAEHVCSIAVYGVDPSCAFCAKMTYGKKITARGGQQNILSGWCLENLWNRCTYVSLLIIRNGRLFFLYEMYTVGCFVKYILVPVYKTYLLHRWFLYSMCHNRVSTRHIEVHHWFHKCIILIASFITPSPVESIFYFKNGGDVRLISKRRIMFLLFKMIICDSVHANHTTRI